MSIDEKIAAANKQIEEVTLERDRLVALKKEISSNRYKAIEALGDAMHKKFCHYNHTDGCGYFYGADRPERIQWMGNAELLLQGLRSAFPEIRDAYGCGERDICLLAERATTFLKAL